MTSVHWDRFPNVARSPKPRAWLTIQANLGLAVNTVEAYGRSIEGYLAFAAREQIDVEIATREHVAGYVHDLASRPGRQASNVVSVDSGTTLANATLQQRPSRSRPIHAGGTISFVARPRAHPTIPPPALDPHRGRVETLNRSRSATTAAKSFDVRSRIRCSLASGRALFS